MTCSPAPTPWLRTNTRAPSRNDGTQVLAVLERHHRVVRRDHPREVKRDGVRGAGNPVQARHLLHQHHRRLAPGGPMLPVVDLIHERLTGRLNGLERRVLGQQVRVLRHNVGLGELDRGLHPALACGVCGLAGQHSHAVVAGEVHRLLIAHWNPGDVGGRDSFLVVGQHIGRGALQDPEGAIQRGEHARRHPIAQRDHDPETGTRPATRRTTPSSSRRSPARRRIRTATTFPAP